MWRTGVALALLVVGAAAHAVQSTATFAVSATVTSGCGVTANPIAFGSYLGTGAAPAIDAAGNIVVTCAGNNLYFVQLNNGNNVNGTQRRMLRTAGPAAYLNYELYSDAARTQRFGSSLFELVIGISNGAPQSIPVYARLPAAQVAPAGAYLDTIQVTLTF